MNGTVTEKIVEEVTRRMATARRRRVPRAVAGYREPEGRVRRTPLTPFATLATPTVAPTASAFSVLSTLPRKSMQIVEIDSISKTYGEKVAVDKLSLSMAPGSMYGLLGPNGAGKTSSIRMMIGMTMPDSGSVKLFGKPFERRALEQVGYLPEERGLYKKMNVLAQLVFFGQLHGLSAAEAARRARSWSDKLQISEALPKITNELSKGMQQKIQFISTLLHEPDLIIMDEPFSGLDPVNATLLEDVLLEQKKAGKAILFSTHRMDQVEKLCDSICLINGGRAVLQGTMREVKARYPRNRVALHYEGAVDLAREPMVLSVKNYAGGAHIELKPGADAQELLRSLVQKVTVNRFEVLEPSLEEIFIQTVGGKSNE
jgi:ABC-2 type transport system ATP-binding protein